MSGSTSRGITYSMKGSPLNVEQVGWNYMQSLFLLLCFVLEKLGSEEYYDCFMN